MIHFCLIILGEFFLYYWFCVRSNLFFCWRAYFAFKLKFLWFQVSSSVSRAFWTCCQSISFFSKFHLEHFALFRWDSDYEWKIFIATSLFVEINVSGQNSIPVIGSYWFMWCKVKDHTMNSLTRDSKIGFLGVNFFSIWFIV